MLMKEDLDSTWQASATFRSAASLCQIGTSVMKINGRSSEGWQNKKNPHHIMVAPECRLWSPMQNLNYKTPERKEELANLRTLEEHNHLQFLQGHPL